MKRRTFIKYATIALFSGCLESESSKPAYRPPPTVTTKPDSDKDYVYRDVPESYMIEKPIPFERQMVVVKIRLMSNLPTGLFKTLTNRKLNNTKFL